MSEPRELNLDQQQEKAVGALRNSIVTAGAGSGKTLVLSQRFLELLLSSRAQVDEILTLTFTRKAAVEMRERIHGKLMEMQDNPDIRQQAARFEEAEISTIDSFCAKVVRSDSLRYGIPPSFTQDNEMCGELVREQAEEFLRSHWEDACVEFLLRNLSFEEIIDQVLVTFAESFSTIASPFDPLEHADRQFSHVRKILAGYAETLLSLSGEMRRQGEPEIATAKKSWEVLSRAEALISKNQWMCSGGDPPGRDKLQELLEELRRTGKIMKRQGKQPLGQFFKDEADRINCCLDMIFLALQVLRMEEELSRFYQWLKAFEQQFHQAKRNAELLSFKDVAELSVDILKENLELRRWFKNRYRYIMIDEFQDNNSLQKDLLYLLAEAPEHECEGVPGIGQLHREKLFFVGDEKQSIYRFRGADVGVFKNLKEELTEHGGEAIELHHNYRSDRLLIDMFNQLFSKIMGRDNPSWEADFSSLEAGCSAKTFQPPVTLFYMPYQEEEEGEDDEADEQELSVNESEAWYIARRLKEEVCSKKRMVRRKDGSVSPLQFDDIALLLQKTSNQLDYEQAFRRAGIPYTPESPRGLFLEAPVNDLYLFLQTAAYPQDRHAYAGLLRSPFCGISDRSLLTLLSMNLPPFELPEGMHLSPEDQHKLQRTGEFYRHICSLADRTGIAVLLRELWYRGGYRYVLLKTEEYHSYLEFYEYLREIAMLFDEKGRTLAEFCDYLRPRLGENKKIYEINLLRRHTPGVRIMTVHKAKGLEFPVVVFANTGGGMHSDSVKGIYWSRHGEFMVSTETRKSKWEQGNLFYEEEKEQLEKEEEAERKRLVYVAVTRAEQWCIISGAHTKNNRRGTHPLNMILHALDVDPFQVTEEAAAACGLGFEQIPVVSEESRRKETRRHTQQDPLQWKQHLEEASMRQWETDPMSTTVTRLQEEAAAGGSSFYEGTEAEGSESPLLFGEVCHRIIAYAVEHGSLPDDPAVLGELPDQAQARWDEALSLAREFFASDAGKSISKAEKAEAEVPFVMQGEGGRLINGQIDLLITWPEMCEVIDFKTDQVFSPSNHKLQLEYYCRAAESFTGKPVQGRLYYLRTGRQWLLK